MKGPKCYKFQGGVDVLLLHLQASLRNEMIQATVFAAVEQKNLLEKNEQRSANPHAIVRGNDHEIDIAVFACHALG